MFNFSIVTLHLHQSQKKYSNLKDLKSLTVPRSRRFHLDLAKLISESFFSQYLDVIADHTSCTNHKIDGDYFHVNHTVVISKQNNKITIPTQRRSFFHHVERFVFAIGDFYSFSIKHLLKKKPMNLMHLSNLFYFTVK